MIKSASQLKGKIKKLAKELEWEIVNTQTADSIEKVFSMTL